MDSSSADGVFIPFSPKDPSEHHILLLCTEAVVFGKKLPGSFQTSYLEPTQQYGCHCQGWLKQAHHLYFLCLPILFLFSFVIHASVSESFFSHVSHQTSFLKLCFYLYLVSPPPLHCSRTYHTIRSKPNKDFLPYLHFHAKYHVVINTIDRQYCKVC